MWYRTDDGSLEERYDFSDALAIGTYLNIFVRNCDWVRMANWAQLVNAIAPIVTSSRVAVAQPIYYPFALHAQGALDLAVDTHVYGPNIDAKILKAPAVGLIGSVTWLRSKSSTPLQPLQRIIVVWR